MNPKTLQYLMGHSAVSYTHLVGIHISILFPVVISDKRLTNPGVCQKSVFFRMPVGIAVNLTFSIAAKLFQIQFCNIYPFLPICLQNAGIP